jgi:hypothetical protein
MIHFNKALISLSLSAGIAFAGAQRSATISVSATVRPAARLDVQSAASVGVSVTMFPNTNARVWAASGSCGTPENPKVILESGIHRLSFTPAEVEGKDRVCLATSDGILQTSALLPR